MPEADPIKEINPRGANPYKGPYAFELKDAALFTGRDEEAETLLSLAISERIVVFCAPSGAGKSSLLNARLIPGLRRRGFKVLPVVRVGGDLPPGVNPTNVFTFNALWILAGAKADPEALQDCTLDGFLKPVPRAKGRKGPPRVLIFDQFEEILTTHQDRWPQRRDFFLQLRQALLDDPTLSVVMSLREDHLAGLDTYAPLLPGQLRTRFRMETLRRNKAVAAARQPAQAAGLPFDPEVAERLVEDLSRIRMAGHEDPVPGEFVEPVQLQVVCYQLWENLKDQPRQTITEEDRRQFGDPDRALEGFYESAVRQASEETGIPEARIRNWCGTALITPTRIRSQVNREPEASGGLPNPAIESLVDSHLVRAEAARGGIWYELAHDRFVEPILRSNERTAPSAANRLAQDAKAWRKADRDPSFLYSGLRLEEAVRSSKQPGVLLSPEESEFIAHSQKAEADAQVRRTRRLWLAVGVLVVLVAATAYSAWKASQQRRLAVARELALAATTQAADNPELGLLLALEAVQKAPIQETEAALHEALRASVVQQVLSLPVSSASSYAFAFSPDGKRVAAVDKNGFVGIWDAVSGEHIDTAPKPASTITSLAYSPAGLVAYGDRKGHVSFWNPGSGLPPPPSLSIGSSINNLTYSPDGWLAIASASSGVKIWNAAEKTLETLSGDRAIRTVAISPDGRYFSILPDQEGEKEHGYMTVHDVSGNPYPFFHHSKPVTSVAFGPNWKLATASQDTGLQISDMWTGKVIQTLYGHRDRISDVVFSPDGEYLATASFDGEARLWNLRTGEAEYVLYPEGGQLSRVAFSPDAGKLATISLPLPKSDPRTATLTLWSIALDKDLVLPATAYELTGFTPDSRSLIAVNPQRQAILWDFSRQKLGPALLGKVDKISRARLTSQGDLLARRGRTLLHQRVPAGQVSVKQLPPDLEFSDFNVSPDGRFLAFFSTKAVHLLKFADVSPNAPYETLPEHPATVVATAFDRPGNRLAIARGDGSVQLWSIVEHRLVHELRPSGEERAHDLAISPDGRWLASAADDRKVRLWDLEAGTLTRTFEGHAGQVISVAFTPDSQRLASGDVEGKVRLWEIAEGRSIFALPASTESVNDLAFSPDGKWLAGVGSGGTLGLEPMALDALTTRARRRLSGRQLTSQERRIYLHEN